MNLVIVISGLVLLAALALLVGGVDTYAREAAWRRIAHARRGPQAQVGALRRCAGSPRCAPGPLDRYFGRG